MSAGTLPLLEWLLRRFPDTPKKRAKQWIQAGRVSVNGTVIRKPHQLLADPGAGLELLDRAATTLDCGPTGWAIHPRVQLLHLDSALAIVNKAPGLLAVPAQPDELSALSILADWLAGKLPAGDRRLPPAYRRLTPLPVHRLDLYTSGVFCLAMNPAAREKLIAQLAAHTMQRQYVAFVAGRLRTPTGTWRNWLRPSRDGLRQYVVSAAEGRQHSDDAVEAVTHYEVVREFAGAGVTKLRLHLETGRKHQIRAQAAAAGVPLLGDRTYNPHYRGRLDRQALHAEMLTLEHPDAPGERRSWSAPLPRDLARLEAELATRRGRS